MSKQSAGLLLYRRGPGGLEVLLAHPGGPFFAGKDEGSWTIPKGLVEADEPPLEAAIREFAEETGLAPEGPYRELGMVTQRGGKRVHAWAFAGEWPEDQVLRSNTFVLEWPPHSGRLQEFPEVDRAQLFDLAEARRRLNPAQVPFLDRLLALEGGSA